MLKKYKIATAFTSTRKSNTDTLEHKDKGRTGSTKGFMKSHAKTVKEATLVKPTDESAYDAKNTTMQSEKWNRRPS